jgi:hypothetical protein
MLHGGQKKPEGQKKPDPVTLLAQNRAAKARQQVRKGVLLAVLALLLLLGLIGWLAWRSPKDLPVRVVAFDQVATPDVPAALRAQLRPENPEDEGANLDGHALFFNDSMHGGQIGKPRANPLRGEKATTDKAGAGAVQSSYPASDRPYPFVVTLLDDQEKLRSYDNAAVYVWPPGSRLLVVEARSALLKETEEGFRSKKPFSLAAYPGAAAALKKAARGKYRIVYLATGPTRPEDYQKLRGWLQRFIPVTGRVFPEGPTLGRPNYSDGSDEAGAQRQVLRFLRERFRGRMVGLVRRAGDARVFQEAGLATALIGKDPDAPRGVKRVKSWAEVDRALP